MLQLGTNQLKVLNAIKATETTTIDELVETTGIRKDKVQNMVAEFHQARLITISPEKLISFKKDQHGPKRYTENGGDTDEWEPYRPTSNLKNLSRLV